MTVIMTTMSVVEKMSCLSGLLVFRIAKAKAIAPLRPKQERNYETHERIYNWGYKGSSKIKDLSTIRDLASI